MTTIEVAAVIAAISSAATFVLTFFNYFQINRVHKATNSMKDELVDEVRKSATEVGITEGRRRQKQENLRRKR
jgi:precorrin-3B methylase